MNPAYHKALMSDENKIDEALRKQAWDYFQMHSGQRLTTFNFYIVISSVITTALFTTFQKEYQVPRVGIALGLLLSLFSFIFWKVDTRNKQLIRGAEAALKFFEDTSELKDRDGEPHVAKVFRHEEYATTKRKAEKTLIPWKRHYSYSNSFNLVFLTFGLIGLLGAVIAVVKAR